MSDPTTPAEALARALRTVFPLTMGWESRHPRGGRSPGLILAALPSGSALVTTETLAAELARQFPGLLHAEYVAAAIIEALRTTQGDER